MLLEERKGYKPFEYPWAYQLYKKQNRMHWLPEEVPLGEDIKDWEGKLTPEEKNLLTHIFRFFTQADIEVANCYNRMYAGIFKPTEVCMMLSTFSAFEAIHVDAYSHLIETLGMPETTYSAFLDYKEMKDKQDYMKKFNVNSKNNIAITLAAFGAFTEGLQLFASFAMLLNFPRFNKMKGMGQIITWSLRDESIHVEGILRVFRAFLKEYEKDLDFKFIKECIYDICRDIVDHEDAFIDLAFELGGVEGMSAEDIKSYVRYIANRRLRMLGYSKIYDIKENPLPWLDEILNQNEHANFFEARATEYSKATLTGDWPNEY